MVKVRVKGGRSVVNEGAILTPDEDGEIDVPKEVADSLAARGLLEEEGTPKKAAKKGRKGAAAADELGDPEDPKGDGGGEPQ